MLRIHRFSLAAIVTVVLCFGILIGSVITVAPVRVQGQASADTEQALLQRIFQQANPSVVALTVRVPASSQNPGLIPEPTPPGGQTPRFATAAGSGFMYDDKGHIVTNNHVIEDATQVTVTFVDGTILPAKVIGADSDSDLAVIQVEGDLVKWVPLKLGDSDKVTVGTRAIVIGNPFLLSNSMSQGFVSAIDRSLSGNTRYRIPKIIQTDAAINPGNSGGPLLNGDGEVIGVVNAIRTGGTARQSSGVGFAIPSNILKLVADELIKNGKMQHAYLGISGTSLSPDINALIGLDAQFHGALVREVSEGGPSEKAGLKASTVEKELEGEPFTVGGDIITAIDGQPVRYFEDLISYLFLKTRPGQVVKLSILRGKEKVEVEVTLASRPRTS